MNYLEIVKKLMYRFPELHTSDNVISACNFIKQYGYSSDIPGFMISLGIEFDTELGEVGILKLL